MQKMKFIFNFPLHCGIRRLCGLVNFMVRLRTGLWHANVTEIVSIPFNFCDVSAPNSSEHSIGCIMLDNLESERKVFDLSIWRLKPNTT